MDERLFEIFMDVHNGLPRQGPGDVIQTQQALAACTELPAQPVVVDLGCGPALQTAQLADALNTPVMGLDLFASFLQQAQTTAPSLRLVQADMNALPFASESVDLLWSEGAIYIVGVEAGLLNWRRILKGGGYLAFTQLVWLRPDPPQGAVDFWASEYPQMTDSAAVAATIAACGYDLVTHFVLPDNAWWTDYYSPLTAKLPAMYRKYADDADALAIISSIEAEIEVRRRYADSYSYAFFVCQLR